METEKLGAIYFFGGNKAERSSKCKKTCPQGLFMAFKVYEVFPILADAVEQEGEWKVHDQGRTSVLWRWEGLLCCGDEKHILPQVQLWASHALLEGRNVCHRKCGFLSYDYRCNYNPKASCRQGKLILILQQYGCTLCRTD